MTDPSKTCRQAHVEDDDEDDLDDLDGTPLPAWMAQLLAFEMGPKLMIRCPSLFQCTQTRYCPVPNRPCSRVIPPARFHRFHIRLTRPQHER